MNRRTFSNLLTTGLIGLRTPSIASGPPAQVKSSGITKRFAKWPNQVYRRLLVDTRVPDWNPVLLRCFNRVDYVDTIAGAGFECLVQYAISCAGLYLWRTKIGTMHRNLKGRDYFGEVMEQCKRRGLHRIAYFHVIWDNHAFDTHPDWRLQPEGGEGGRYGYTCPNTPYRDYVLLLLLLLLCHNNGVL